MALTPTAPAGIGVFVTRTTAKPPPYEEDQALWRGTASNGWMLAMAVGLLIAGPTLFVWGGHLRLSGIVLTCTGVPLLVTFSSVACVLTKDRFEARLGPLRWPRIAIPLDQITSVTDTVVKPMAYLGWGYRLGSNKRAIVIRGGQGVQVESRKGPALVVSSSNAADIKAAFETARRPAL